MVSAPDIPGHRVAGILGRGGFATVYRSWQLAVGREVAVKVDNRVLLSERDRRRFVREVTAAGRLSGHPHVIDVYDAGTLRDGRPYLVMELCPAGSLNDAVRRHGPMTPAQVCGIGIRIADAIAAAHAAGVLHRDIKPANILVNRYSMVGLSDFGLASIAAAEGEQSATREALTPAYASPESFRCEEPTVAADLYSLAATLYSLLAGRPPRFPADAKSPSLATIMMLHDKPVEDVPGVPPELMAMLRRSLAIDPAERPPSAAAMRDILAAIAAPTARPRHASRSGSHRNVQPGPNGQPGPNVQPGRHGQPGPNGQPDGDDEPDQNMPPGQEMQPGWDSGSRHPSGPGRDSGPPANPDWYPGSRHPSGPGRDSGPPANPGWYPGSRHPSGPGRDSGPPANPGRIRRRGYPGRDGSLAGPAGRRRPMAVPIALAAGLIMIISAAAIIGAHVLSHSRTGAGPASPASSQNRDLGPGAAAAPGVFGVATATSGCPAASVRAVAARCPAAPECWAGLVVFSGSASARSLPCTAPHTWQTFAIAILPAEARTFDQNIVEANRSVRAVCSRPVLLQSRQGPARRIPVGAWEIEVLPPDEAAFDSGARAYRCVAAVPGAEPSRSEFGG